MELSQYLDIFVEEAKEHLLHLNEGLMRLEQRPDDKNVISDLFRSAHTLKGMAATMGFEQTAKLTHRMESTLDLVRQDQLTVDSGLISVLLSAVDLLERLVESAAAGQEDPALQVGQIVASLPDSTNRTAVLPDKPSSAEPNEHELMVLQEARNRGWQGLQVDVELASGALLKAARAFMVFQRLEQHGEVIKSDPSVTDIEAERFADRFTVWIVTPSSESAVQDAVSNIADVAAVRVTQLLRDDAAVAVTSQDQDAAFASRLRTGKTVRVDIGRLDRLMNLVSELVITRTRLTQLSKELSSAGLADTTGQLSRVLLELQDEVMKVRMVAVDQVFSRFPRMVRDLSQQLNKQVEFAVIGQDTELDRTIIDEIGDPLVHLLRNALDHGLETTEQRQQAGKSPTGSLKLAAYHRGDSVFIEVTDDGRGIDPEKVKLKAVQRGLLTRQEAAQLDDEAAYRLLFQPGFSTAERITDVSGRGVGLDVVATKIAALGGRTLVQSEPGLGSTFTIILPLTLAILATLQVKVGQERYAIPLSVVDQTALIKRHMLQDVQGHLSMHYREHTIPVLDLRTLLQAGEAHKQSDDAFVVVVYRGKRLVGLLVDELVGQEEVVIKSMGRFVDNCPGISGATILGDGGIALILDVMSLV